MPVPLLIYPPVGLIRPRGLPFPTIGKFSRPQYSRREHLVSALEWFVLSREMFFTRAYNGSRLRRPRTHRIGRGSPGTVLVPVSHLMRPQAHQTDEATHTARADLRNGPFWSHSLLFPAVHAAVAGSGGSPCQLQCTSTSPLTSEGASQAPAAVLMRRQGLMDRIPRLPPLHCRRPSGTYAIPVIPRNRRELDDRIVSRARGAAMCAAIGSAVGVLRVAHDSLVRKVRGRRASLCGLSRNLRSRRAVPDSTHFLCACRYSRQEWPF